MVLSVATEKIPSDITGNRSRDRPTSSAVPVKEEDCKILCYKQKFNVDEAISCINTALGSDMWWTKLNIEVCWDFWLRRLENSYGGLLDGLSKRR